MTPRPEGLRLSMRGGGKSPRPPFGLGGWSSNAMGTAVVLDATDGDLERVESIVTQIPRANSLAPGSPLVVFGSATSEARSWRRLFGAHRVAVTRAARCSAMLARGYVDIGAGVDDRSGADLAWGWTP
jgi:hypothetical protein